jgi:hypothetical protein
MIAEKAQAVAALVPEAAGAPTGTIIQTIIAIITQLMAAFKNCGTTGTPPPVAAAAINNPGRFETLRIQETTRKQLGKWSYRVYGKSIVDGVKKVGETVTADEVAAMYEEV